MFYRKQDVDARAFAEAKNGLRDLVNCVLLYFLTADHAERPAYARVEQAEVVIDLGGGGDGGARVPRGIFLPDGDGGSNAINQINIGLFNAFQELASVSR